MRSLSAVLPRSSTPASQPRAGREAVVLGASMAGLLAATVVAKAYDHVTLVERDELVGDGEPRRGVPQGRHAHLLLPRGGEILDELFPGLLAELCRDGGATSDSLDRLHFEIGGHLFSQDPMSVDTPAHVQSRPFLEAHVLRRVRDLPNVTVLDGHDVVGIRADASGRHVIGARVAPRDGRSLERHLPADLVVAATGRNSTVPAWLTELGYDVPDEEEVRVDIKYATRRMRLDRAVTEPTDLVLIGPTPTRPTLFGALVQEHDTWVVTLAGFAGHHPPTDPDGWLAFAERTAPGRFVEAIRAGEYLDGVHAHRFPANLRRRYDRLVRFPDGLLVVGDAVCSFNPIYGQGMTVAALEALALRDTLAGGSTDLPRRFFKAASRPVARAWQFAVGADLSMPPDVVPGPRALPTRLVNGYIDRYQAAAEDDPVLATHFLNVTGFDEPVRTLFGPSSVGRLVQQRRRRVREDAPLPVISG
jgi:2-polyprenyl-6-methoxyphenol hydroxylase-like FAD-dependent oxidoreductase